ncbi:MAG: UDP-N-acetylmuramate dehydrogenase [bacterium]
MIWIEDIKKIVRGAVTEGEPLSRHTTFKIGGPADLFFEPADVEDLRAALAFLRGRRISHIVVGQGSNLLFGDAGYRGCVTRIGRNMAEVAVAGDIAEAGAGAPLHSLVRGLVEKGRAGLESLIGIPGAVGGAIFMNVGAFGQWISGALESVDYIDEAGAAKRLEMDKISFLNMRYRWSIFQEHPERVITGARFQLEEEDPETLKKRVRELSEKRKKMQPYNQPSAGSFFKNPEGIAAGLLIDKAGLKGFRVGGAEVSPIHANFIVNAGGATCADVLALAEEVRRRVVSEFGVALEPEVRIIE